MKMFVPSEFEPSAMSEIVAALIDPNGGRDGVPASIRAAFVRDDFDVGSVVWATLAERSNVQRQDTLPSFVSLRACEVGGSYAARLLDSLVELVPDRMRTRVRYSQFAPPNLLLTTFVAVGRRTGLALLHVHEPRLMAASGASAATALKCVLRCAAQLKCGVLLTGTSLDAAFLARHFRAKY